MTSPRAPRHAQDAGRALDAQTYKCLLCGVDHEIIGGRVVHTVFAARSYPDSRSQE